MYLKKRHIFSVALFLCDRAQRSLKPLRFLLTKLNKEALFMRNLITHFQTFTRDMSVGVILMCAFCRLGSSL